MQINTVCVQERKRCFIVLREMWQIIETGMQLTFAVVPMLTVYTHTHTYRQTDDKRGEGAQRAVIYTVSTPPGHDGRFETAHV